MKETHWQLLRNCFLWLVFPFMVFPYLVGLFWITVTAYHPPKILLHCSCQVAKNFTLISKCSVIAFYWYTFPQPQQKSKLWCCGTQTTRLDLARHKKRCSAGWLTCFSFTKFQAESRAEVNFPNAKKHSKATARVAHECKKCDKAFQSVYLMQEHKQMEHGEQRSSGTQNGDVTQLMGGVDLNCLNEELETCIHFLMDSEIENGKHRVYRFVVDTLDPKDLLEKLDVVFHSLECAAKLILIFGFVLKNVEDGSCRYYFAHKNKTLMQRSKLVATTEDLTKIMNTD